MTSRVVEHVELELELRRLAGVSFVATEDRDDVLIVQIVAVGAIGEAIDELRNRAERIARAHVSGAVSVVIDTGVAEAGPERERVQLLAVLPSADGTEIEVHLAFGPDRTVGRGSNEAGLAEAATATLEALRNLRLAVPYTVSAASGLASPEAGEAVVIVLSAPDGKRYGVATGATQEEAAARATLHALNRSLRRSG